MRRVLSPVPMMGKLSCVVLVSESLRSRTPTVKPGSHMLAMVGGALITFVVDH